jgi:hypothetical protein
MTSAPPSIMGSIGLRPSFLLRIFISYYEMQKHNSEKEPLVREDYLRVLRQPLFALGKILPQTLDQVKHYFRYSTEFLMRHGYLNPEGTPLDFSSFVCRLYTHEPYNFILTFFSHNDTLHKLVEDEEVAYEKRLEKLLAIFAYFFSPMKVHSKDVTCKKLESLPESIAQMHQQYTNLVLKVYTDFVRSYSILHPELNEDTELPLSKIKFKYVANEIKAIAPEIKEEEKEEKEEEEEEELVWRSDEEEEETTKEEDKQSSINIEEDKMEENKEQLVEEDEGELVKILKAQRQQNQSTSSFTGLSGNNDIYTSVERLLATIKRTIVVDLSIIPYAPLDKENLNSYAVDFLSHGHLQRLCKENSFHSAITAKSSLSNINTDLRTLRSALDTMKIPKEDILFRAIKDLSDLFSKRFYGYETRRKKNQLKSIVIERSDMDKYGPRATREEKKYGEKRPENEKPQTKAKEKKVRRTGKML